MSILILARSLKSMSKKVYKTNYFPSRRNRSFKGLYKTSEKNIWQGLNKKYANKSLN